jgi:hypothetical protein
MLLLALLMLLLLQADDGISFNLPLVTSLSAFTAVFVKGTVDAIKGAVTVLPSQALPFVGVAVAFVYCIIVLKATSHPMTSAVWFQCILAAVGSQFGAMAVTSLQNWANDKRDKAGS